MNDRSSFGLGALAALSLTLLVGSGQQPAKDTTLDLVRGIDRGLFKPGSRLRSGSNSIEKILEDQGSAIAAIRSKVSGITNSTDFGDAERRLTDLERVIRGEQARALDEILSSVNNLERARDATPANTDRLERAVSDLSRTLRDIERRLSAIERAVR